MLNIRIKNASLPCSFSSSEISIDIRPAQIVGISGEGRKSFMLALMGKKSFEGDIVIDEISLKADYEEYIKNFEYISATKRKHIDRIKVEEFLDLTAIVRDSSLQITDEYQKNKNDLLEKFSMLQYKEKFLSSLEMQEQLFIEFIALFLRKPKVIVIDDFFSIIQEENLNKMLNYICKYVHQGNICVLTSENFSFLMKIAEKIYEIEMF